MNYEITENDLQTAGITLPVGMTLEHLNTTLNERVGVEITESLSDTELDEMMSLQESGDTQALANWINAHVEDLAEIVEDERDILLGELADTVETPEA